MRASWFGWAALGLVAAVAACDNAGVDLGFSPETTHSVTINAFLDRDGNGVFNAAFDTAYAGARVAILQRSNGDTVKVGVTTASGQARFNNLPLGEYQVAIVTNSLGDTLEVAKIDSANIAISALDSNTVVIVRLSYPVVTIRQARQLPAGKRVFLKGVILSGVQQFRDTTSHLSDSSGAIRMTRVSLRGAATSNPGDSVTALGYTSIRAGQPTLDQALVTRIGVSVAPLGDIVTTGVAANAAQGVLDAALVFINGAAITDTATVAPDFRVTVTDGTGSLNIILDAIQPFDRSLFIIGKSVVLGRGVLVPSGAGAWVLKPRDPGDIVVR